MNHRSPPSFNARTFFKVLMLYGSFCLFLLENHSNAFAEEPPMPAPATIPLGFVVSGGVSLGAYQGGFLYYISSFVRQNPQFDISILTGASAGSINAFLTLLSTCSLDPIPPPKASLFWKAWIPLGFDQLAKHKTMGPDHMFSRSAFTPTVDMIKNIWIKGLRKDCERVFGVSVTRKSPMPIAIKKDLPINRHAEQFVLKIIGQGPGKPPIVQNILKPNFPRHQIALFLGNSPSEALPYIINLLYASSAFPLAFEPQDLSYCLLPPNAPSTSCTSHQSKSDTFVDGGVFDNNPLHLAYTISDEQEGPFINHPVQLFGYLDSDAPAFPQPQADKALDNSALQLAVNLLGDFIHTSREKELSSLLLSHPEVAGRVFNSKVHLPLASSPMYAFFGFFEKDFRIFDFYAGMYDAKSYINAHTRTMPDKIFPDTVNNSTKDPHTWLLFHCLEKAIKNDPSARDQCRQHTDSNLIILYRTSIERLKLQCQQLPANTPTDHALCAKYLGQGSMKPPETDEFDFIQTMNLLAKNHFEFRDLGLKKAQADQGILRLKHKLALALSAFSHKQPEDQRQALSYASRPLLNVLQYTPSPSIFYVVLGNSWELGYSSITSPFSYAPSWARYMAALQINGLNSLFGPIRDTIALTPLIGFSFEPYQSNDAFLQWRLGLRLGYQYSLRKDANKTDCDSSRLKDPYACHLTSIQPFVALSMMDWLRFQFSFQNYLRSNSLTNAQTMFFVGLQFHLDR